MLFVVLSKQVYGAIAMDTGTGDDAGVWKKIESQRNKKRWWLLIDAAKFIDPYEGDKKVTVEFKTRIRLVTRKMSKNCS